MRHLSPPSPRGWHLSVPPPCAAQTEVAIKVMAVLPDQPAQTNRWVSTTMGMVGGAAGASKANASGSGGAGGAEANVQ